MPNLINLTEHLAQDGYNYSYGISAVDLTGNGVPDLITPDTEVGLYWLENDGQGNFTKPHHPQTQHPNGSNATSERRHQRRRPPRTRLSSTTSTAACSTSNMKATRACPAHGAHRYVDEGTLTRRLRRRRGRLHRGRHISISPPQPGAKATSSSGTKTATATGSNIILEDDIAETRAIHAADINGNGKTDLLGTARIANQVIWYENSGDLRQPSPGSNTSSTTPPNPSTATPSTWTATAT